MKIRKVDKGSLTKSLKFDIGRGLGDRGGFVYNK